MLEPRRKGGMGCKLLRKSQSPRIKQEMGCTVELRPCWGHWQGFRAAGVN